MANWRMNFLCEEGRSSFNGTNFRYVIRLCRNLSRFNSSYRLNSTFVPMFEDQEEGHDLMRPETIVTFVLCVVALLFNVVSIMATSQISKTSHTKVIISLAASDILVSVSVFMHVVNGHFNVPPSALDPDPNSRLLSACIQVCVVSFNNMANLMSLLNLLAIAIDHYIAILMPYRYVHLLNRWRTNLMITILWIIGFLCGFSSFFGGFQKSEAFQYLNFCEITNYSDFHSEYFVIFTAAICSVAMLFIYTRIFCVVRRVSTESTTLHKDGLHNTKALRTSALIIGTFVVCWLPNLVFQVSVVIQLHALDSRNKVYETLFRANRYLYILVVVNSVCDPIIYAARLKIVQKGYFKLLSRFCGYNNPKMYDDVNYSQSKMELLARKRSTLVTNDHRESHPEVQAML
ncbi:adenosine receptor A2b-like [Saccostrea echinata]|uniref:adenosine receptor A2b-like n=1 Tax=Saccostrea echinata TaxID=191078 RepID=UPI002A8400B5|nr:adenosine receptor A2b-like [Saccostrea echinata]